MELLAELAAIDFPVMLILFMLAVALILIDYFFPVDYPAYLGYLFFAAGMFWAFPLGPLFSLLASLGVFVLLLVLHRVWFSRYLTNAQEDRSRRRS